MTRINIELGKKARAHTPKTQGKTFIHEREEEKKKLLKRDRGQLSRYSVAVTISTQHSISLREETETLSKKRGRERS